MSGPTVTIVGAFPPPVGGAAKNNQLLWEDLQARSVDVRRINIGADALAHVRSLSHHWRRLKVNFTALMKLASTGGTTLYLVPDGGLGVWYSLCHVAVARLRFAQIVLHHRTFRYVRKKSLAMQAITAISKASGVHVFLSAGMAAEFQKRYGPIRNMISTNARYVEPQLAAAIGQPRERSSRYRVGHLSNLCRDKGFFDVADTFDRVIADGTDAELHLAGPVIEDAVRVRLDELQQRHGERIDLKGPLSGKEKDAFYRALDVFLFPTRFDQEAAPNVIYESLAAGTPVIATPLGCIQEMVANPRGAVCASEGDFVTFAASQIGHLAKNADSEERARTILTWTESEVETSKRQYQQLRELLTQPTANVRR